MHQLLRMIILLIFFSGAVQGQTVFRRYLQGPSNSLPRSSCLAPGGGYLICVSGNSFIRLDSTGSMVWAKALQSPVYVENVAAASDSGFVFSGYTYVLNSPPFYEIAAGKLDAQGNLLWLTVIDSTNRMTKSLPLPTPDGGLVVGMAETPAFQSSSIVTGIARFSALGQLLWHRLVYYNPWANYFFDLRHDGADFVVSARQDTTAWMYGFDGQGNISWSTQNNSLPSFQYSPYEITAIPGGYATVIRMNRIHIFDVQGMAQGRYSYQSPAGSLSLENLLGTADGGLLVGGRLINAGDSAMLLMKTDAAGNVSWATTYDTTVRFIRDIRETHDGYFILREMQNISRIFMLKTDLQGHAHCGETDITVTMQPDTQLSSVAASCASPPSWAQSVYHPAAAMVPAAFSELVSCLWTGTGDAEQLPETTIFPNPSGGVFFIDAVRKPERVDVYDALGKLILTQENGTTRLDLSLHPPGIYLLRMRDGDSVRIEKLLLRK